MAGIVAWAISRKVQGIDEGGRAEEIVEWKSQMMGYASAMLYCKRFFFSHFELDIVLIGIPQVGSRIPQICE